MLAQAIKILRSRLNDIVLGSARNYCGYGVSAGSLFWHLAGVLDQPSGALRLGRGRPKTGRRIAREVTPRAA